MDDKFYLNWAYNIARTNSTDPSTQNGAVLVDNRGVIMASGSNHFPKGVKETPERWERPLKYAFVEHAERNCLFEAAKRGGLNDKLTMYCCWAACADCARAIIQMGIKEVVTHHDPTAPERFGMPTSQSWLDSIKVAMTMFEEAGVKIRWIDEKLGNKVRFNGQEVEV